ncbi:unnamed protein product [Calypogeia fissa]
MPPWRDGVKGSRKGNRARKNIRRIAGDLIIYVEDFYGEDYKELQFCIIISCVVVLLVRKRSGSGGCLTTVLLSERRFARLIIDSVKNLLGFGRCCLPLERRFVRCRCDIDIPLIIVGGC